MTKSKKLKRLTSSQTLDDLKHLEDTEARTQQRPSSLPLKSIRVAPNVFQRRLKNEKTSSSCGTLLAPLNLWERMN